MSKSVLIVGAGAAGLACAADLARKGVAVTLLEARDRIGGRIFTQHPLGVDVPVELGAEFIHGRPRQIFEPMQDAGQEIMESTGDDWCFEDDGLCACEFFEKVDELLERMKHYANPDRSFAQFLHELPRKYGDEKTRLRALEYVSGFNAADPNKISVQSLLKDMQRQEEIGGDHTYRLAGGYDVLVSYLEKECFRNGAHFRLRTVVKNVEWSTDNVAVAGRSSDGEFAEEADHIVVTVPVSMLQQAQNEAGIIFTPELPKAKLRALRGTAMEPVVRMTLVFHERFWDNLRGKDDPSLSKLRFLLSHDPHFPTWWTTHPAESPVMVAWSPAARAEQLAGRSREEVTALALVSLSKILPISLKLLEPLVEATYMHDWQADPFARGAYSYLCVGAADACEELARPLGKLHFAGEATDVNGDHATVHGAIASGQRAAREILEP